MLCGGGIRKQKGPEESYCSLSVETCREILLSEFRMADLNPWQRGGGRNPVGRECCMNLAVAILGRRRKRMRGPASPAPNRSFFFFFLFFSGRRGPRRREKGRNSRAGTGKGAAICESVRRI